MEVLPTPPLPATVIILALFSMCVPPYGNAESWKRIQSSQLVYVRILTQAVELCKTNTLKLFVFHVFGAFYKIRGVELQILFIHSFRSVIRLLSSTTPSRTSSRFIRLWRTLVRIQGGSALALTEIIFQHVQPLLKLLSGPGGAERDAQPALLPIGGHGEAPRVIDPYPPLHKLLLHKLPGLI